MVLLDNGHGINTPGKRSPVWADGSQLLEWEFNRAIVDGIYTKLEALTIPCLKLVPEDTDIPLYTRVLRANAIFKNNPDSFLVSVHANAGGGTGWEIFTSKGQTKSDELATFIFGEAHAILPEIKMRTDVGDGDPDKEESFAILRDTNCPAVLTENLFMDTEKDCKFIMSEEGRNKIVDLHVNGIIRYIENR